MSDVALKDLCLLIVDSEHKTAPKDPDGLHPLVRTTDLGRARADLMRAQRVNSEVYSLWTKRAIPTVDDLILAREAPVGGIFRIPDGVEPVLGQRTVLLRPDPSRVDSRFLMYRLASDDLQSRMTEMSTGSTVPHLNMADIRAFPVPRIPALPTQRLVATILSAFDTLIEINERRMELLEDLARSLYREWFVRFRHPHDQDAARSRSELGLIPRTWTVRSLGEVAEIHRRSVRPGDGPDDLFEHFSIPAFDNGKRSQLEPGRAIKSAKYRIDRPAVLLAKINPRIPRVWFVHPGADNAIASTEFLVWTGTDVSNAWLWTLFTSDAFRGSLVSAASGTSTSHQRVNPGDIENYLVPVPPADVREDFESIVEPMLALVAELRDSNSRAAATMGLMLPRLVTGQLDISDIDLDALAPPDPE